MGRNRRIIDLAGYPQPSSGFSERDPVLVGPVNPPPTRHQGRQTSLDDLDWPEGMSWDTVLTDD